VATQLQLTDISYNIIYHIISYHKYSGFSNCYSRKLKKKPAVPTDTTSYAAGKGMLSEMLCSERAGGTGIVYSWHCAGQNTRTLQSIPLHRFENDLQKITDKNVKEEAIIVE
jgi:hypothetical protein